MKLKTNTNIDKSTLAIGGTEFYHMQWINVGI